MDSQIKAPLQLTAVFAIAPSFNLKSFEEVKSPDGTNDTPMHDICHIIYAINYRSFWMWLSIYTTKLRVMWFKYHVSQHHKKFLPTISSPDTLTSSATIELAITSATIEEESYPICFETNGYNCIAPRLTINHQQSNAFTVEYESNKRIKCTSNNQCSPFNSCITNYPLTNQTIPPFTNYPITINPTSNNEICNATSQNITITMSCSFVSQTNQFQADWSTGSPL